MGDQWINDTYRAVPVQRVKGEDGQPTGDILTGPVRLSWVDLFELPKPTDTIPNPKYGAVLLFPPITDFSIIHEEYYKQLAQNFASYYSPDKKDYIGVHSPFRDQVEKSHQYQGYTPGCVFMTCSSQFKPPVVDGRSNPIVDPKRAYSGVWAICSVKPYPYGKDGKGPMKKGIGFGLQTVMIIGDDTDISGGAAADPKATFKGINVQAPITRPTPGAFNQGQPTMPPMGVAPPAIPQQRFTPPMQNTLPVAPAGDDDDMSWNR